MPLLALRFICSLFSNCNSKARDASFKPPHSFSFTNMENYTMQPETIESQIIQSDAIIWRHLPDINGRYLQALEEGFKNPVVMVFDDGHQCVIEGPLDRFSFLGEPAKVTKRQGSTPPVIWYGSAKEAIALLDLSASEARYIRRALETPNRMPAVVVGPGPTFVALLSIPRRK